jgi:hypothetical protein
MVMVVTYHYSIGYMIKKKILENNIDINVPIKIEIPF